MQHVFFNPKKVGSIFINGNTGSGNSVNISIRLTDGSNASLSTSSESDVFTFLDFCNANYSPAQYINWD
ncbi:MAG: hypothetical protein LBS50_06420 [Prevotellaceae bacterium]|jgi:hypothetical protein|nr:hypothetical protein [Prevotellaceae bacterium]